MLTSEVNPTKILFWPSPTRRRSTSFATGKFSLEANRHEMFFFFVMKKINNDNNFKLFAPIPF